jgi:outer membrane protein OmpA-like peptidoglycan-associated protein
MLRRMRGACLTLAVLSGMFLLAGPAWAASDDGDAQNNHNAPYLRMGVGARALAMGGAFVGVADDVTAGYWNPAGLTWTTGWQIGGMYSNGLDVDRRYNHIGFARNSDWGAYGLNWLNAGVSDIDFRGATDQSLGSGSYGDNAIMLSFGKAFDMASLGITAKYLMQGLDDNAVSGDNSINGYGIDLGLGLNLAEMVRLGFVVQDIAGKLGSDDDANDIPTNLRLGLSFWPMPGFIAAADIEKTQDDDEYYFHVGGEYGMPLTEELGAAIRAGLNDGDFALGFGVNYNWIYADYAYVNDTQDFLNENHRFGVSLKFNQETMERPTGMSMGGGMRDADRDGIPDDVDQCPTLAEDMDGFMDADGCPDQDNDGDGIQDMNDDCPAQAEDMDGWQDSDGCPEIDNDADGIMDKDDKCPSVAETFNNYMDDDGCPDEGASRIPALAYINFKFNSAEISGADPVPILEDIARILRENPDVKLKITGHTDSIGGDEYNARLSLLRAETIKNYLVARGVGGDRVSTEGKGEAQPVDTNDTETGRARNRRIEFSTAQ